MNVTEFLEKWGRTLFEGPLGRTATLESPPELAEIRFPILNPSYKFIPAAFPPLEGAIFYDIGVAWDDQSTLKWSRAPGDDPIRVRTPLQTFGVSVRANLFGIALARLDYSIPQERKAVKGLWTFSLGPAF